MAAPSPPDVAFEGDSLDVLRRFPKDVREDLGGDLRRLQNDGRPLDSRSMAPALRGVFELRDRDKDNWYRLLYVKLDGVVYVLHAFIKKTSQTSRGDIEITRKRLAELKARLAKDKR